MAAVGPQNQRLIRCPVCLKLQSVLEDPKSESNVTCRSCSRQFKIKNGLPAASLYKIVEESAENLDKVVLEKETGSFSYTVGAVMLAIAFVIGYSGRAYSGPSFMLYYLTAFAVVFLTSTFVRWSWQDTMAVSTYGFLLHEGIAVTRLFTSLSPAPRNYGFLIMTMIFGGLLFYFRAENFQGSGSGNCSSTSSCGSSCGGGGGCGGGGCGGGGCGG